MKILGVVFLIGMSLFAFSILLDAYRELDENSSLSQKTVNRLFILTATMLLCGCFSALTTA